VAPLPAPVPTDPTQGGVTTVTPAVVARAGYVESEYTFSGNANAYAFTGTPGTDGAWSVMPAGTAKYESRMVVWSPSNPQRFSGRVIVEWNNVSGATDAAPDLVWTHNNVFRDGDIYVGVAAQFVGVASAALSNPGRYGDLLHPGDSYSYDIFSQAGMAVRNGSVLGGLQPRLVIASGESQSAGRLTTYIDALAPVHNVYDGYLVHSRGAAGAPLQQPPGQATVNVNGSPTTVANGNDNLVLVNVPSPTRSRTDLLAPVLVYNTETDVFGPPDGVLGYGPATQPSSAGFRLWEAAGTAHADDCVFNKCASISNDVAGAEALFEAMLNPPTAIGGFAACSLPINTGEETYTLSGAYEQLKTWAATGGANGGTAAAAPPLFDGQSIGEGSGTTAQRDANGNILGGVRSPAVDVPVATLNSLSNTPGFCSLSGRTVPFSASQIATLYRNHGAFVSRWTQDVDRAVAGGFITAADGALLQQVAAQSGIGK
jgi:hypothetical protein